ncbi:MAG: BREX-1 system phosphatase PglZ type A [Eubacterium sp.]|nr:BREX-1 system phosphatase PglZ type A [Eubacterium sp.]
MDTDKIIQDLNTRFAYPLPEFYKRRIIFWYDEEKEFEDKLEEIVLDNAKIAALTGTNTFTVKKLLCYDDTASNYLVYFPLSFSQDDDNWLINVQLYSEEYRADLQSIWIDEMGLPSTQVIRRQVKNYRKFFNSQERRTKVKTYSQNISTASQVHLAVMAAVCGNKDIQPGHIIQSVLSGGLDSDTNKIYRNLVNYGAQNAFWAMVSQATGYSEGENSDLGRLAVHILLTAATRTMHPDHLSGLDSYISTPHQAFCYDTVSDWMNGDKKAQMYETARFVEDEVRLSGRFLKLSVEELSDTEIFPCVNECILIGLMTEISDRIIQVDVIRRIVEKRRTFAWYEGVSNYYVGILQAANMQDFFLKHADGFHTVEPEKIWKEYTKDYYRMDTYYRQFHLCFQNSLKASNPKLDDLFKQVTEKIEGLYSQWFLGQLGENWSKACEDNLARYGRILEVPQQRDFYQSKVKPENNRIFVIISDALRFEVGAALAEQLRRETQSKVELNSVQAVFPAVTKFGMAALLPHKELSVKERTDGVLAVLADGQSTEAGYRDKVLKKANPKSTALKYKNIIGMKRAERSALVKGMDVVYIYHDKIDETGHTSESAVFSACQDAITEIKNLVRIIVNEFSGTRIIITADHGFLYTYSPLKEDDKVDKTTPSSVDVEVDRRYLITKKGANPKYLMPVKFMDRNYSAFAPRENIRIKKKGGGLNYVHGGISLQEMVVPVMEYHYLRSDSKTYKRNKDRIDTKPVELNILSSERKISNMIFSLSFYQKEAVSDNREACSYLLYFVDSAGNKVSDTQKIIADKKNQDGRERTFRCSFNLRSQKYSSSDSYYLVIADESGLQMPQKEEFQIDIPFAVDDFNFFS